MSISPSDCPTSHCNHVLTGNLACMKNSNLSTLSWLGRRYRSDDDGDLPAEVEEKLACYIRNKVAALEFGILSSLLCVCRLY